MTLKEYRQKLKEHHICRNCKKTDAFTLLGRTYCADCAEKLRLAKEKARQDPVKKEKMLQATKDWRERHEENHRCTRCGRYLFDGYNYKTCAECRLETKRSLQARRVAKYGVKNERGKNGICWQCNKNPCIEGKKLCQSCYDKKLSYCRKNLGIDNSNVERKEDNERVEFSNE